MKPLASLLHRLGIRRRECGREELTATGPLANRDFVVPNMVCEGCAESIAGALASMPGVQDVTANVPHRRIRVRYEPWAVHEQQITDALAKAGFEAVEAGENA